MSTAKISQVVSLQSVVTGNPSNILATMDKNWSIYQVALFKE
jgi:hypothetical protein